MWIVRLSKSTCLWQCPVSRILNNVRCYCVVNTKDSEESILLNKHSSWELICSQPANRKGKGGISAGSTSFLLSKNGKDILVHLSHIRTEDQSRHFAPSSIFNANIIKKTTGHTETGHAAQWDVLRYYFPDEWSLLGLSLFERHQPEHSPNTSGTGTLPV